MKITRIETVRLNPKAKVHQGSIGWTWVRLHTDSGLIGTGETYPIPETEAAVIHKELAPVLLGADPLRIEALWREMFLKVNYHGWAGAEFRALSAVDMALWDLFGHHTGLPLYQLLGGAVRERIRTYNTCYDNQFNFMTDADKLATSLLKSGITAMKIWPFDAVALANQGNHISEVEIDACMEPLRKIRKAVGEEMEIMMEFHGYWNVPAAVRIAKALEPFNVVWLEEMLPQDNLDAYVELGRRVAQPLNISERLFGRWAYADLMKKGAADYVMFDLAWCGGVSEAKRIAILADAHYRPVAPHNCGGPLFHMANLHLAAHMPNLFVLESVRRHYQDEYPAIVTHVTVPDADGQFPLPPGPGLGSTLREDFLAQAEVQTSG